MELYQHLAAEPFAQQMGISVDELRPGYARASMTLAPWMVNVHGTAHGGMLFALADVAFAAASNSHGTWRWR
jgi:acyl-CoA thioesterase